MTTTDESTSDEEVAAVVSRAAGACAAMRRTTAAERARWLTGIADTLDANAVDLIEIAAEETHIAPDRLTGEVKRTTDQLRMFASVIEEGSYLEVIIDHADRTATPPQPDLRRMLIPIGPVAVFSASNFPFAFSVAGGDTASALASGNPVVVKGHSGHPRLSARTAEVVFGALHSAGAPDGAFGHVIGHGAGISLVQDSRIKAAAFTGSTAGGRALFDLAMRRPEPIPFYGELGSANPVLITPAAGAARADELAAGLAASFQLGLGQLCTKPGVVLIPRGSALISALQREVAQRASGQLLTPSIHAAFTQTAAHLATAHGVRQLFPDADHGSAVSSQVWVTDVETAWGTPEVLEEQFGPSTVIVEYDQMDGALALIESLGGSLTVTLHSEPAENVREVVARLENVAGRVLLAGWPTGVAVTWSQHHGGPWPSTTSLHTSVGATAVRRFLRPIVYQSAPDELLPLELREENPLEIPRRVDGHLRH